MAQVVKRTTTDGTVRYDVRTRIDGRVVTRTFKRRKDADAWANTTEADKLRGVAVDPRRSRVTFESYANGWLNKRRDLAERTSELYRYLLDKHILPTFGSMNIGAISPSAVRTWHSMTFHDRTTTGAKAYRLLRAILNTAVSDEIIVRNPCQVKGAGQEKAPERPVATVAEVEALAQAMPERQRIAVYLAAWCQLRRGELLGLRRRDVDTMRGTVTVANTRTKTMAGAMVEKPPKTDAGRRSVAVPPNVLPALRHHLEQYVGPEADALVLDGGYRALRTAWDNARKKTGLTYHLHDLRHAGLTWSAAAGATTAELMRRAGHASPQAALRYQHATEDRDQAVAKALAELAPKAKVVPISRQRKQR